MQLKASSQVGSLASSKRISNSNRRSRSSSIAATSVACAGRSEEHTSELQSRLHLVCRLLLEKKKKHSSCCTDPTESMEHRLPRFHSVQSLIYACQSISSPAFSTSSGAGSAAPEFDRYGLQRE